MKVQPKQIVRGLIGLKILILMGVLFTIEDGLYIGDKNIQAQDEKSDNQPDPEIKVIKDEGNQEDDEESGRSKSLLDDLLYLPKPDKERIRREEMGRYFELIERKQGQINNKIKEVKRRQQQLEELEQSINQKLKRLDDEKKFLLTTLQEEKEIQKDRLEKLITLYEKMKPKQAAPVFEQMDRDLVVNLWKSLPQKQITKILEKMAPEKSVELTEYYGRVRSGREYELLREVNKSLQAEFEERCQ